MSPMGCLWLFMALFSLGYCNIMSLSTSANNGFACPNETVFFSCIVNGSSTLAVSWHVNMTANMTSVQFFLPTNIDECDVDNDNISIATYSSLGKISRSYLEILMPQEGDLTVTCSQEEDDTESILILGMNPLSPVELHQNNNILPNLVQLNWTSNSTHLINYYEVQIDNEVHWELRSTFVNIIVPADCREYNVTVIPVNHCNLRGAPASINICRRSNGTDKPKPTSPITTTTIPPTNSSAKSSQSNSDRAWVIPVAIVIPLLVVGIVIVTLVVVVFVLQRKNKITCCPYGKNERKSDEQLNMKGMP